MVVVKNLRLTHSRIADITQRIVSCTNAHLGSQSRLAEIIVLNRVPNGTKESQSVSCRRGLANLCSRSSNLCHYKTMQKQGIDDCIRLKELRPRWLRDSVQCSCVVSRFRLHIRYILHLGLTGKHTRYGDACIDRFKCMNSCQLRRTRLAGPDQLCIALTSLLHGMPFF